MVLRSFNGESYSSEWGSSLKVSLCGDETIETDFGKDTDRGNYSCTITATNGTTKTQAMTMTMERKYTHTHTHAHAHTHKHTHIFFQIFSFKIIDKHKKEISNNYISNHDIKVNVVMKCVQKYIYSRQKNYCTSRSRTKKYRKNKNMMECCWNIT